MTNDDIIRMALEAGLERDGDNFFSRNYEEMDVHIDDLKRFAEIVAKARDAEHAVADEREACAKACEQSDRYRGEYFAALIRERGNQ